MNQVHVTNEPVHGVTTMATSSPEVPKSLDGVDGAVPLRTWDLKPPKLVLGVSRQLNPPEGGEVTTNEAWLMITEHPRLMEMDYKDFGDLAEKLEDKVQCYG